MLIWASYCSAGQQRPANKSLARAGSFSIETWRTLEITNNTTLTLDGPVGPGQTVLFDIGGGANGKVVLTDPSEFQGQISGFQGNDQIDLPTITFDSGTTWVFVDNAGDNTGGTLIISETVGGVTTQVASLTFSTGNYTTANFKLASDGSGHTLINDPPASTTTASATTATAHATVAPVAETSTLTATETTSSRRKVTSTIEDEAFMVALSTAVAVALSEAVGDANGGVEFGQ